MKVHTSHCTMEIHRDRDYISGSTSLQELLDVRSSRHDTFTAVETQYCPYFITEKKKRAYPAGLVSLDQFPYLKRCAICIRMRIKVQLHCMQVISLVTSTRCRRNETERGTMRCAVSIVRYIMLPYLCLIVGIINRPFLEFQVHFSLQHCLPQYSIICITSTTFQLVDTVEMEMCVVSGQNFLWPY